VNGFIVLLPLMVVIVLSQPLYRLWLSGQPRDFSKDQKMLDSLVAQWEKKPRPLAATQASLFAFDPNKISIKELQMLGLSEILSTRIANYRQKGGQFRVKSDLLKIYGFDTTFYYRVYTYIRLPEKINGHQSKKNLPATPRRNEILITFDLNAADTVQLKTIYGIGPVLSKRIIRFRDALGGFIRHEQLNEVYGLDSAVISRLLKVAFITQDFTPKQIDMNTADEKQFASHPYIKKFVARAIVAYRFQHGKFTDVADLHKLNLLRPEDIDKVLPYLKIND
jgi:DNA uptake protein ComE-like DNA-binding protein